MKLKINFLSKLNLACSTDALRPIMQTIYFKHGYAYATNGHLVIRQRIALHSIDPAEYDNLEGKYIHKDIFRDIIKHPTAKFLQEYIEVTTDAGEKIIFNYFKPAEDERFPDVDSVISNHSLNAISEISFNPEYLKIINECLVKDGSSGSLKYMFDAANKGILVTTNDVNGRQQVALLMPAMIFVYE